TAQWEANEYTVNLDPNGGEVEPSEVVVVYDSEVGELPVPTRTGYTFTGWFDAQGNEVTAETVYTVADDSTYTANWVINEYTVTFDKNGGKCKEASRTVKYGSKVGELPEAWFNGHEFAGWYDKNGNKVDADYVITEDTVLTARWVVVIHVGGSTSTIIGNITDGESNPNTGAEVSAPVSALAAIAVMGGAVVLLGKRK
ncbi:MAG: InlB B-repeat-containing protein, partial [Oscillospiraceae bacterium]|nr:InlB B-repeat-containing protein [Oscillospiraceae bacterium]